MVDCMLWWHCRWRLLPTDVEMEADMDSPETVEVQYEIRRSNDPCRFSLADDYGIFSLSSLYIDYEEDNIDQS